MNLYLITARFYGFSERKLFYLAVLWNELTPSPKWVVWLCLCSVCLCSMYKKQLSCCNICVGLFYCAASLRIRITYQNHLVMQCKLNSATKETEKITGRHSQHRMLHSLAIIWLDYGQSAGVCVCYSSQVRNQRSS